MNVPWVDPCAFSPSWQLARRKVRQNQACTEHNPSDWQLCPLVTVWLSPKLLYFTEIMIFYGHRFEDNCCILRVVVLQGDTAASFGEEMGGKKVVLSFFPSLSPTLLSLPLLLLFISSIFLFICISCSQEEHPFLAIVPVWCPWEEGDVLPQTFPHWAQPHLMEITQFSNEVWKSKHSGAEKSGRGGKPLKEFSAHGCCSLLLGALLSWWPDMLGLRGL